MKEENLILEELTTYKISNLISQGFTTILVVLGSLEQHGPALPLITDAEHGRETCLRAAKKLGNTLVGPTVPFGYSPQHLGFPGTTSISEETLGSLIHDIADSLVISGFKLIYFWISHAENTPTLVKTLEKIEPKWEGAYVTGLKNLDDYISKTWACMAENLGVSTEIAGSHAGEIETSMMLSSKPKLVKMELAQKGNQKPFDEIVGSMMLHGMKSVSGNGVLGDQRHGSSSNGNYYLEVLADYLVNEIMQIRQDLKL
jgi:creatinine amidohydrolase